MARERVFEPLLVTPENQSAYESMQAYIADYSDKPEVAKRAAVLTSGLDVDALQSSGLVIVEESTEIAFGKLVAATKQNFSEFDKKIIGKEDKFNRSRFLNGLLRVFMYETVSISDSPFLVYSRFNDMGIADALAVDTVPLLYDKLVRIRQEDTFPTGLIASDKGRNEARKLPNNLHLLLGEYGVHLFKQFKK